MRVYEAKISYTMVSEGENVPLSKPSAIAEYLKSAFELNPVQEQFYVVFLNRRNRPLGRHQITIGTLSSTLVSPREVFRGAILASASAIVVAHNHPSGAPSPSRDDIGVTRRLREAAKIMDIDLLDHVIVGTREADSQGTGLFSFREAGML
jgi:DNA repair protein RadC